jgi:hypothetical protein
LTGRPVRAQHLSVLWIVECGKKVIQDSLLHAIKLVSDLWHNVLKELTFLLQGLLKPCICQLHVLNCHFAQLANCCRCPAHCFPLNPGILILSGANSPKVSFSISDPELSSQPTGYVDG